MNFLPSKNVVYLPESKIFKTNKQSVRRAMFFTVEHIVKIYDLQTLLYIMKEQDCSNYIARAALFIALNKSSGIWKLDKI
jgi:hypothetical protein